ncbi:DUF4179 domain-containing protein [Paenibacillus wenxiniae]|uniref:DUF4179 domain-containing protein n=1 Tax=Paenibacillus wenxiniae TaxID=1636843 RepID=A0ABW4RQ23_9BACL
MSTNNTDRLERMLKQIGQNESVEQDQQQAPSDIQAELQAIYEAIEQGQPAAHIRDRFTRSQEQQAYKDKVYTVDERYTALEKEKPDVDAVATPTENITTTATPGTMTAHPIRRRHQRMIRYGITAAAIMIIGAGSVIGSAFFSADMARTLKQLPGTSQLYQLTSQWGWQTADEQENIQLQPSIEQNGIKLTLRSLLYDGKKVNIELEQQTPKQHAIQQVEIYTNGRQLSSTDNEVNSNQQQDASTTIYSLQRELQAAPLMGLSDTELADRFGQLLEVPTSALPQQVDLQIHITLQGMTDKPFVYHVHAKQNALPNYSLTNTVRTPEGIGFHGAVVQATPVATYIDLTTSYSKLWKKWSEQYNLNHGYYPLGLTYTLTDSNDRIYRTTSNSGRDPHTFLEFEPIIGQPAELIVTPWSFNEEPIQNQRPIQIFTGKGSNLPLTLDMGTTGKVTLLAVDSTSDQYLLRI